MRRSPLPVAAALMLASCTFESATPEDAQILCASDDDCPLDERCGGAGRCVLADDDLTPPAVISVTIDPPAISIGTARIVIEANEALADAPPVLSSIGAALPAPAFEGTDGARATLLVDVTDLAEGLYAIDAVSITDAAGNTATRRLADTALLVDKTAPTLVNVAVTVAPDGLADVDGQSALTVTFLATEPLAVARATLGGLESPCELAATGLSYACAFDVRGAGIPDGENIIAIDGEDAAGNTTSASTTVEADTSAPRVVEDSVSVSIDPAGPAVVASVCEPGSLVSVSLVLDEPPATVSLVLDPDGVALPLDVTVEGRRIGAVTTIPDDMEPGAYAIHLFTTDAVGHSADAALALPAPHTGGLFCQSTVGSGCAHPGSACIDYDNDGSYAIEASCLAGSDCSDIDATVFPGAPEVPGDGRANGCDSGVEAALDATHGVFVSPFGNDNNTGTASAPVASLGRAATLLTETRGFLFLVGGALYPAPGLQEISGAPYLRGFIGGLVQDGDTWRRDGAAEPTEMVCEGFCDPPEGAVVDGIHVSGSGSVVFHDRTVVVRSRVTAFSAFEGATVLAQSTVGELHVLGASTARFVEVSAGSGGDFVIEGTLFAHRSVLRSALPLVDGRVSLTSSIIDRPDRPLQISGTGSAVIAWSTILDDEPSNPGSIALVEHSSAAPGALRLLASILHRRGGGPFLSQNSGSLAVRDCSFGRTDADLSAGPLYSEAGVALASTPAELNGGTFPACPECVIDGNFAHALSGFVSAPCAAAVDPALRSRNVLGHMDGDLTPAYADFFGRCRANDDDKVDVGPFEAIAGTSCSY